MRVLLVEDNEPVGRVIVRALRSDAVDVRWTRTGAGALASVREAVPDLVLLDFGLPDMDGAELLGAIRDLCETRVVGLSGDPDVARHGLDGFVAKPVSLEELRRVVSGAG